LVLENENESVEMAQIFFPDANEAIAAIEEKILDDFASFR
jgi:hypothetical protein